MHRALSRAPASSSAKKPRPKTGLVNSELRNLEMTTRLRQVRKRRPFQPPRQLRGNQSGGVAAHHLGESLAEGHHLVRRTYGDAHAVGPRRPDAANVHVF